MQLYLFVFPMLSLRFRPGYLGFTFSSLVCTQETRTLQKEKKLKIKVALPLRLRQRKPSVISASPCEEQNTARFSRLLRSSRAPFCFLRLFYFLRSLRFLQYRPNLSIGDFDTGSRVFVTVIIPDETVRWRIEMYRGRNFPYNIRGFSYGLLRFFWICHWASATCSIFFKCIQSRSMNVTFYRQPRNDLPY